MNPPKIGMFFIHAGDRWTITAVYAAGTIDATNDRTGAAARFSGLNF